MTRWTPYWPNCRWPTTASRCVCAGAARPATSGAGLGLAIVDRVARSHGGALDLLPVAPHGLLARLRLPLVAVR